MMKTKFTLIFAFLFLFGTAGQCQLQSKNQQPMQEALYPPSISTSTNTDHPVQAHPAEWSNAIPYYNLANKYLEKARYEDAVDNYHEAIARYPGDPDFYINLGFCYRKLEDFESAEQAFRQAIKLNGKDWVTWSNLANALLKQNKLAETVSTFEKCLKLNPPAKEKAAMTKDIADIKKIMAMRKPEPVVVTAGKGALPKVSTTNTVSKSLPKSVSKTAPKFLAPANTPQSKAENGWDYVYK